MHVHAQHMYAPVYTNAHTTHIICTNALVRIRVIVRAPLNTHRHVCTQGQNARIRSYHYHFHAHVQEYTQRGDRCSNAPTHTPMHVCTQLSSTCSRRRQSSRIVDCGNAQWAAAHLQVIARVSHGTIVG